MAFRKQDPSVYHSIERTSHTDQLTTKLFEPSPKLSSTLSL
jgi:hypothetical protein